MTDITVHIQPADGPVFDYSLDPKTTIAELREILIGDEMIEGDELIMITDTRARIPKIQEAKKTFESISNGDKVVKLTLYKKNQPEQRPEETKLDTSGRLSLSSPGKEESVKSLNREPSLTGYVDVMELTDDEIKNILNKCSYLYGRKVESDLRVTEAAKKFFADIPENRQFEQSNRSSQNHLGEKFIRISRKEEQEALIKGYSEGNVKLSVKLVADVQGKLHKGSTNQTTKSKEGEFIYMESAYHSATFKLREIRSVVSDDVKNFFKPGEAMSTEKMYEFLNTFGALVPESITVGGKRYTTIEAKSIQSTNSTIDIDDKSIQADLTIKMFGIGGSGAGGNHNEKKASNFSRQDSFTMQCFGGNPEFKDQPDEWIRSVCRNWSTWQIVSIQDFRYTYEYLDEPFRTWFKRIFEPNSIEHLQYQDGSFYAGQTISGKKEGKGKLTYVNGDVYEGQFRDDKEDGPGKLTKKTGEVCKVTWKNGVVDNWMTMTMPNRVIYEGPMEDFKPEGQGTWTHPNGDVFIIPLKNSKEDGVVTKKCEDGRVIEVVFENGVVVNGKWTSSGDVYEGDIVHFRANGHGILKWNSGNIYEGQFIDDYMHGSGKFTYHAGGFYEGEWKHGRRHGNGTFIASQGRPWRGLLRYDGEWVAGEMCGQGTAIECNGYRYTGSFSNNYFHGTGEFQILPKTVIDHPLMMTRYEGDLFEGNKEGFGRMNYANGFIYEGEFKKDQPDGKGSLFWKGKWEKGTWDYDKIEKKLNK